MSLKTIYNDYYGDETRWFVGVVEDIKDPLKQGRIKVRIFGVHSDNISEVPKSALPWAQVVAPVTHGGTSGINGTAVGIKPYAQVFGMFLDGKHSQLPLVLGSIPRIDGPNPKSRRPDDGNTAFSGPAPSGLPTNTTGDVAHNAAGRNISSYRFEGGSSNERVYNLLEEGFRSDFGLPHSKELAAGFVGNFMVESGETINYLAHNKRGGNYGANGIAQWRGERYTNLLKFANAERAELYVNDSGNLKVPDLKTQAAFVLHELKTVGWLYFAKWGPKATTARLAADRVERYYEIHAGEPLRSATPEARYKDKTIKKRVDYAAAIYSQLAHKVSSDPIVGPGGNGGV